MVCRTRKTRKPRRGGSGIKLPTSFIRRVANAAKTAKKANVGLRKPSSSYYEHANLTEANLENLHTVNTNTQEWKIFPGNRVEKIPRNIQLPTRPPVMTELSPGVRVFTSPR